MQGTKSVKQLIKRTAISGGVYGPLKRMQRRLLDDVGRRLFRENVSLYAQFVRSGDICFDVGSNVGTKTGALLALGAKVVAFEPRPSSFREMKARCSPNRRSSLVADWAADNRLDVNQVPVTTLDLAIARYGLPRFCRIDLRGSNGKFSRASATPCLG